MRYLHRYAFVIPLLLGACDDGDDLDPDAGGMGGMGGIGGMAGNGGGPGGAGGGDMGPDANVECMSEIFFEIIDEDTVWRQECSPYQVQGSVLIRSGTLTIEPGVEVLMGGDGEMAVGQGGNTAEAAIQAVGTADQPIRFGFLDGTPSDNPRWTGFRFQGPLLPSTLQHVHIDDCGNQPMEACIQVRAADSQLTLDTLTINNAAVGLDADGSPIGTLSALRFTGEMPVVFRVDPKQVAQLDTAFEYPDGAINRMGAPGRASVNVTGTWINHGIPWLVDSDLYVEASSDWMPGDAIPTLTIEAGVELQLQAEGKLHVGDDQPGGLIVNGTAVDPVRLVPQPGGMRRGQIKGLIFGALARDSAVDGLHILSGGFESNVDSSFGCLSVGLGADLETGVTVRNSTFEDCGQAGIGTDRASDGFAFGALSGNTFRNSPYGVRVRPNHLRTFTGDQTYDGTLNNAIIGGVSNRAPGILSTPATWAPQPVPYNVIDDLEIEADLIIEAPNTFSFEPDRMLRVAEENPAHLIAMGEDGQPVEFQAANGERGGWNGIVFYPNTLNTTNLTFVVVRDAGAVSGNLIAGSVNVRGEDTGPISIVNSLFLNCAQAGIAAISPGEHFLALAGNRFDDCPVGLHLHPDAVGDVAAAQGYMGTPVNFLVPGKVMRDASWVDQGVPWQLEPNGNALIVEVEADLTIGEGITVQWPLSRPTAGGLIVGDRNPGRLVVAGTQNAPVTFRSAEAAPAAEDWRQVQLLDSTLPGSTLNWLRVEHAGQGGRPAIRMRNTLGNVTINSPRFGALGGPEMECEGNAAPLLTDVPAGAMAIGCPPP